MRCKKARFSCCKKNVLAEERAMELHMACTIDRNGSSKLQGNFSGFMDDKTLMTEKREKKSQRRHRLQPSFLLPFCATLVFSVRGAAGKINCFRQLLLKVGLCSYMDTGREKIKIDRKC